MTLIVGITTAEGIVVGADSRVTIQWSEDGRVLQRADTGTKIWLQAGRLAIASCGAASIDVPQEVGAVGPTGATLNDAAHEVLGRLARGVVSGQEWVVLLGGVDAGVPTLLRLDVARRTSRVLSGRFAREYRAWAEGCLPESRLPEDTETWTLATAHAWAMTAMAESARLHPEFVGPPFRAIAIRQSGLSWVQGH